MELVRPRKVKLSLDMAPLIDIVFQLLIFFMLTASFSNPSMKLTLPKAKTADEPNPEKILISINPKGEVYLNSRLQTPYALPNEIKKSLSGSQEKIIHIQADENTPYKYFIEVMDISRQAGAKQISVVHDIK